MSYVSGFMMGAAIGKSVHQFLFGGTAQRTWPQAKQQIRQAGACAQQYGKRSIQRAARALQGAPVFACVSDLPGRRRYRAAMLPELAALLADKLSQLKFLHKVEVCAQTGSLLLLFAPEDAAKVDALADFLRDSIFRSVWQQRLEAATAPLEAHAGALTRSVRGSVRDFSAWIKRVTHGWLDVSSTAFLIFLLRGLRKMVLTRQYPSASQMLWWAVSVMRGWRTV